MDDKLKKQEIVFQGKIFNVCTELWKKEDGITIKRDVCYHKDAVAVLPITDKGTVYLVKQYRHAIRDYLLEIPAGLIEEGESPEECLRRELLEETGCTAKRVEKLAEFFSSPGFTNERIYLYLALVERTAKESPDSDEGLTVYEFDLKVVENMISSGEIKDAKTIMAILLLTLNNHKIKEMLPG